MEPLKEKLLKEFSDFCNRHTLEWEISITDTAPYCSEVYSSSIPSINWTVLVIYKDQQDKKYHRTYDISVQYESICFEHKISHLTHDKQKIFFCEIHGLCGRASLKMDSNLSGFTWECLDYDRDNLLMPEIGILMKIILDFFDPEKKSEFAINRWLTSEARNWRQV